MLKVNGGKQVKDDPRTDRNSDTCPHSSNAPGERSSGGSSSSGGPNKGEERSPTQDGGAPRTECSPPSKRDTSSGGSSGRSSSSGRESGGSSDSKPSNPGGANKGEERSPTQGGGAPRTECSPPSKRDSSGGGGSFDRGERDGDSDRDSGYSGGGGSGYRPSAQSQPVPKPPAQHGQGNDLSQKPNPAVEFAPKGKTGLRNFFDKTKNTVSGTITKIRNKLNEGSEKRIDSLTTAGYVLDKDAVGGFGHAGWFVANGEGGYSFFEVIDLKNTDNNKLEKRKRKDGREGTFLSRSPLKFPTPGSAEAKGYGSEAGVLKTDFGTKDEMFTYLKNVGGNDGYDTVIEFDINSEQCKKIFDTSMDTGERFQGYNVASNSCGITARDVLTVPGSGISKVTTMRLGLFWGVSPTGIGDLLWMRNHGIADRYDIPPISAEGGLK